VRSIHENAISAMSMRGLMENERLKKKVEKHEKRGGRNYTEKIKKSGIFSGILPSPRPLGTRNMEKEGNEQSQNKAGGVIYPRNAN